MKTTNNNKSVSVDEKTTVENPLGDFILNRMSQSMNKDTSYHQIQLRRWKFLDKLHNFIPLTREEKMDFIRLSLEGYVISDTTIDILVRKMIRWTLPGWVSLEFNSNFPSIGYEMKINHSDNTLGLSYETSLRGCDCPGFRGSQHCHHHDSFVEIHDNIPSSMDEGLIEKDYRAVQGIYENNDFRATRGVPE